MKLHDLNKPPRSQSQVMRDIIAKSGEQYLIANYGCCGEPYWLDTFGQSFREIVRDIATGQHDYKGRTSAFAVVRVEPEDITEKVAEAVLDYIIERGPYDEEGHLKPCPFLDEVMPTWTDKLPCGVGRVDREYEKDDAA